MTGASDIRAAYTAPARGPGIAYVKRVGEGCSATKTSTIALTIGRVGMVARAIIQGRGATLVCVRPSTLVRIARNLCTLATYDLVAMEGRVYQTKPVNCRVRVHRDMRGQGARRDD